jgi:hypothetical protein
LASLAPVFDQRFFKQPLRLVEQVDPHCMEGENRRDNKPGSRARKRQNSGPLQEYDFFVTQGVDQSQESLSDEPRPPKEGKREAGRNKSKVFFLPD